jgi:hypothetical protein
MRVSSMLVPILLIAACGSPRSGPPSNMQQPGPLASQPLDEQGQLRQLAERFVRAAIDGKPGDAKALVMTPQQFRTISIYPTPDDKYNAELATTLAHGAEVKHVYKWSDVEVVATSVNVEEYSPGADSAVRVHTRFAKVMVSLKPRGVKCDQNTYQLGDPECIDELPFEVRIAKADGIDWACWPDVVFPQPSGGSIFEGMPGKP